MKRAKTVWPISPNFVTDVTSFVDIENYITPDAEEPLTHVDDNATMEDVVVLLGKFPSKGQARKNGWTGPIPWGFNVWQIGKEQFVTLNMDPYKHPKAEQ